MLALMVAGSGAASGATTGIVIGLGLTLDIVRGVLPRSGNTRDLINDINRVSHYKPEEMFKRTRTWECILYTTLGLFVVVGFCYYLFAPVIRPDIQNPHSFVNGSGLIFELSNVLRKFSSDLSLHGYAARAGLLPGFYSIVFALWLCCTVIGCLFVPRDLALEWGYRVCTRARKGLPTNAHFGWITLILAAIMISCFFVENNMDSIDWKGKYAYRAIYASNLYFPVYSIVMGIVSALAAMTCGASLLYCIDFNLSKNGDGE